MQSWKYFYYRVLKRNMTKKLMLHHPENSPKNKDATLMQS